MLVDQADQDWCSIDWQGFVRHLVLLYEPAGSLHSTVETLLVADDDFARASDNHSFQILGPHDSTHATTSGSTVPVSNNGSEFYFVFACRTNTRDFRL
jgi:hypothetical protein